MEWDWMLVEKLFINEMNAFSHSLTRKDVGKSTQISKNILKSCSFVQNLSDSNSSRFIFLSEFEFLKEA